MADRVWFHCPLCPDDVWKEEKERVRLPKGIKIKGYVAYYVCRHHAKLLVRYSKKKKAEGG